MDFQDHLIEQYTQRIANDPQDYDAYFYRALAHEDSGRFAQAAADYQQAAEIEPRLTNAFFNWGYCLSRQGLYDDALFLYEHTLTLDPEHVATLSEQSFIYRKQRNFQLALTALETAYLIEPTFWIRISILACLQADNASYFTRKLPLNWDGINHEIEANWHNESPFGKACYYAVTNQIDNCLSALQEHYNGRPPSIDWLQSDPDFDTIRVHPDFQAYLANNSTL